MSRPKTGNIATEPGMKKVSVCIPEGLHKKLRIESIENDESMINILSKLTTEAVENYLNL